MHEVDDSTIVWISKLKREFEERSASRRQFLDQVSKTLNERNLNVEMRNVVYDYALDEANRSRDLRSDSVDPDTLKSAGQMLVRTANRLEKSTWLATVNDDWPSPIAHEFHQLMDLMHEEVYPDGILLQLRDVYEVLTKFTTAVLAAAIIDRDDSAFASINKQLLAPNMSLGLWVNTLENLSNTALSLSLKNNVLERIAQAAKIQIVPAVRSFTPIRNDRIGHSARAFNPEDTANLIVGCLDAGTYKNLSGNTKKIMPLSALLENLVDQKIFSDCQLTLDGPKNEALCLNGTLPQTNLIDNDVQYEHDHKDTVVSVRFAAGEGEQPFPLSPYIAARVCTQCDRRDIFIFDSIRPSRIKHRPKFDLLDYARGHKSRMGVQLAPDLFEIYAQAVTDIYPNDLNSSDIEESLNDQAVLESLDKARIDQNYLSPAYLRNDLTQYLAAHSRGVYWLQGPAHTGKSTFVQGIAETIVDDAPIDPRFAASEDGRIIAYYCRKEHRSGIAGFINTLARKLDKSYVSDNNRNESPRYDIDTLTPETFVAWLEKWRQFAITTRGFEKSAPLMVIIDGLDEAEDPSTNSLISLLPAPQHLPDHLYFVLTSRPIGEEDAPEFLVTHVESLYA